MKRRTYASYYLYIYVRKQIVDVHQTHFDIENAERNKFADKAAHKTQIIGCKSRKTTNIFCAKIVVVETGTYENRHAIFKKWRMR